jgi:hypothetical protein
MKVHLFKKGFKVEVINTDKYRPGMRGIINRVSKSNSSKALVSFTDGSNAWILCSNLILIN